MKVQQLYTGCLAEAAYYISSEGEAAIIDPLRDPTPYLEMARADGATIKYVLETHFHADFVSGHLDLARKTGAQIVYGPTALPDFEAHVATDGEVLPLGKVQIKVLHTPGHTLESVTYLLLDEAGREVAIFTGDTLFIGDVGRPDLAVKTDLTREDLAGHLYDSLRHKIMPLPDGVIVYPGHGAGSACGKNMSKETVDTLGHQKQVNYALQADLSRRAFMAAVTADLVAPPQYFPQNAMLNRKGYDSLESVLKKGLNALDVATFVRHRAHYDTLVLDTRSKEAFAQAHIPGSLFLGLDDNFASWAGALIPDLQQPLVFIADAGREEEVVTRLSRVGHDNTLGYLKGGLVSWQNAGYATDRIDETTAAAFAQHYHEGMQLLDVRKASEYQSQHVAGARNVPLASIFQSLTQLDPSATYYLHCQGGYRSMVAASILRAKCFGHVVNITGGFNALRQTAVPLTAYHEPVTQL
ncbi:Glyoxylase, beta-lactamase superfamily II [Catalinimonas alkaloidigena]|uniref:Glyoxylase, beta-lactamase superfamily II n=1 Tax=Catalinimonas alkaloidigena TaxID=1075417 RepID=A0A1G9P0U0_9BACT|nr:MBL fold metallo-hydrolase [Catalinimonas alkaloidigena]SDL92211.1 Glyoxylase, beta-lactamase superfamily II [Catalinimonas alkaloidigena]